MAEFVLDPSVAVDRFRSLEDKGEVWFNLKTNPSVGSVLAKETDARFVATGAGNLQRVDPKRAVLLVQGESREQLESMADRGLHGFIVDNEGDLGKVRELPGRLFLRIKVKEHSIYTGKYFAYGIPWRRAADIIRGMDREVGIHFHRKTQNVGEWSLLRDLQPVLDALGGQVREVNIGGGLPVEYHNSKPDMGPIFQQIEELGSHLEERGVGLVMEPGRYIAAPAVELHTRVLNAYGNNLVLDASLYNSFMDSLLFNVRLPVKGERESGHEYLLKGCSPDSLDIFRYRVFFENEKKEGDAVVFSNAGAYNFHTDFADLPRLPTVTSAGNP